jgi:hypothetical protein
VHGLVMIELGASRKVDFLSQDGRAMRIVLSDKAASNSRFLFVCIRDVAYCCLRDAPVNPEVSCE